jgi:hypothetical protein
MDPDPGGPKTYGSYGSGFGSATLEGQNPEQGQDLTWAKSFGSYWDRDPVRYH